MLLLGTDSEAQRLVAFELDRLPAAAQSRLTVLVPDVVADALHLLRDVAQSASDRTVSRRRR